jgi:hypothetical protein
MTHRPWTRNPNGTIVDTQWKRKREQYRRAADTLHQLGLAHRWTTESARKAALTMWKKKKKGASGQRLGFPVKRAERIDHATMRKLYSVYRAFEPVLIVSIVSYDPDQCVWRVTTQGQQGRIISERAALTRLGHLKARKR